MSDVSRALSLYLGRSVSPFPCSRPDDVRSGFGDGMVEKVDRLLNEVGALEVDWKSHSLQSATVWAEAEMRQRHPNLTEAAIADLGWAFSYWNR